MPRRRKLTPRKEPTQERAKATVDAVLQAAAYILVHRGWDALTTNAVAQRAGVNIASLYQYFPNKESIVAELQRRHVMKAREGFAQVEETLRAQPSLRAILRGMIEAGVREHRIAPALHRAFTEELPRSARALGPRSDASDAMWRGLMAQHVRHVPDLDLALFITRSTLHAAIHDATSERPSALDDPRFIDELVVLIERYLVRPAPRARRK